MKEEIETMQTKFTRDGRKFAVLDELNDSQFIVQEIFVDNNQNEVAHGEKIAINKCELRDSPISSWKDSELKKFIADWEREEKKIRSDIEKEKRALSDAHRKLYLHTKVAQDMAGHLDRTGMINFVRLLDFLCGNIKWFIEVSYGKLKLKPIEELDQYAGDYNGSYSGMKLFTLFGNTNGNLQYKMNDYGDGSGGDTTIYVFCDYEEALEEFKKIIREWKSLTQEIIDLAKEYGVRLDSLKVNEFYKKKRTDLEKILNKNIAENERLTKELNKLQKPINNNKKEQS